ncbi:MAG: cell division protein ZapE [Pseudomonadota bacterium]
MSQTLIARYRAEIAAGRLNPDAGQRLAIEQLALLERRLTDYDPVQPKTVRLALFGWGRERTQEKVVPGLYLYGGVGRGKSMLMDMFYAQAPITPKRRVHFHAFMQEMHDAISRARTAGRDDPIPAVADGVADSAHLLCFDEMQITDITDAMLVGRLFEALFARGVVVVATSNRHPDDLYKDGLNRHLFLPFIALIKDRLDVHEIGQGNDHRQGRLAGRDVWHTPLDAAAKESLDAAWNALTHEAAGTPLVLPLKGREVTIPKAHGGVGWASFAELCEAPLGAADYLALTAHLRVLILSDIPALARENANAAKRFVTLVDTLYEAKTRLIASAAVAPDKLYTEAGDGAFEFERTVSRLTQMQAADWPDTPD